MRVFHLTEEEYKEKGIQEFYDMIATKLGNDADKSKYDVHKIYIARNIFDKQVETYVEKGYTKQEALQVMLFYGASVDEKLKDNTTKIYNGFIKE